MNTVYTFDIVIVGAGLSGLALAIALSDLGLQIALVDAKSLPDSSNASMTSINEMRALALSYSSQQIFSNLGLWNDLKTQGTPIQHVHVSDRGSFGFTRIHASDYRLPCLGTVIAMQVLQQQLIQRAKSLKSVTLFYPATIQATSLESQKRNLQICAENQNFTLSCSLVISADGSHSTLRDKLGIGTRKVDYQQTAIVANVGIERPHDNTAYERFTATGPLALLPIAPTAFSLVWTVRPEAVVELTQLDPDRFLHLLQQRFGYRVGRFNWIGSRQSFPLALVQANSLTVPRALVIGNAAHTLHPIAGQGFNLGLRDVAILAEEIQQQISNAQDIGADDLLTRYSLRRKRDYTETIGMTDNLVKIFSNDFLPLQVSRNLALLGIDISPLKTVLAKRMMGISRMVFPHLQ